MVATGIDFDRALDSPHASRERRVYPSLRRVRGSLATVDEERWSAYSRDSAPRRRSLATAHGGARSAPAVRVGSGRSPLAGRRRQTRLEAQAQGTAAIQAWLGPTFTPHPRCGNCGKLRLWNRRRALGLKRRVRATLRRSARRGVTRTGEVRENRRKERELLQPAPHLVAFSGHGPKCQRPHLRGDLRREQRGRQRPSQLRRSSRRAILVEFAYVLLRRDSPNYAPTHRSAARRTRTITAERQRRAGSPSP
jgi:hypothetical protein